MKKCIACGMPMMKREDHAMGDVSKGYCRHCSRPDGSMQSYDEKLASMTQFLARTKEMTQDGARDTAIKLMASLPAWRQRFL